MKVVLAGASGFIGGYLHARFKEMGKELVEIGRSGAAIRWDDEADIQKAVDGAEFVINLAGRSVNCRYNSKNKKEIYLSRLCTTHSLGMAILQCKHPPKLWINASTATIYRDARDRGMTELEGDIGTGFSVDVATRWENTFFGFDLGKTRQVAVRMAIVLGNDGGAFEAYRNLVRFGFGGCQGDGEQKFSFVHIHDLFEAILFLKQRTDLSGVFNVSTPFPVTNRQWMKALRDRINPPVFFGQPKWMLKLGALFIGSETELLLKSRWVLPDRLTQTGFRFRYARVEEALDNLMSIRPVPVFQ